MSSSIQYHGLPHKNLSLIVLSIVKTNGNIHGEGLEGSSADVLKESFVPPTSCWPLGCQLTLCYHWPVAGTSFKCFIHPGRLPLPSSRCRVSWRLFYKIVQGVIMSCLFRILQLQFPRPDSKSNPFDIGGFLHYNLHLALLDCILCVLFSSMSSLAFPTPSADLLFSILFGRRPKAFRRMW